MSKPQDHPLWPRFWVWAVENGCDSESENDWGIWWECFIAGAVAMKLEEGSD